MNTINKYKDIIIKNWVRKFHVSCFLGKCFNISKKVVAICWIQRYNNLFKIDNKSTQFDKMLKLLSIDRFYFEMYRKWIEKINIKFKS